jgi:hypothetical protein
VCADCGQVVQTVQLTPKELAAVEHLRNGGSLGGAPLAPRVAPGTADRDDRYDGGSPPLPSTDDEP